MNSQINEAIRLFQVSEDRAILDEIKTAMHYDYLSHGVRDLSDVNYVALRCLRLLSGRLSTIKFGLPDTGGFAEESPRDTFDWYMRDYKSLFGRNCTLETYFDHAPQLMEYYEAGYVYLWRAYKALIGNIQSARAKAAAEIIAQHWPDIETALMYAIGRVDTDRTPREIVRYINLATKTAYVRQQFAGKRRVRRGGKARYVEPYFYTVDYVIFGVGEAKRGQLSKRQTALLERIEAVIMADKSATSAGFDMANYVTDINGKITIKVRYIAGKLGLREDSLGRALRTMISKIA